jgi:hypothetical protein
MSPEVCLDLVLIHLTLFALCIPEANPLLHNFIYHKILYTPIMLTLAIEFTFKDMLLPLNNHLIDRRVVRTKVLC